MNFMFKINPEIKAVTLDRYNLPDDICRVYINKHRIVNGTYKGNCNDFGCFRISNERSKFKRTYYYSTDLAIRDPFGNINKLIEAESGCFRINTTKHIFAVTNRFGTRLPWRTAHAGSLRFRRSAFRVSSHVARTKIYDNSYPLRVKPLRGKIGFKVQRHGL